MPHRIQLTHLSTSIRGSGYSVFSSLIFVNAISSMTTQQFNITTPVVQWPHKQCNDHYNYMLKVVQKFSGHWYSYSTLRTLRKYGALSVSKLCLSQSFEFNTGIKVSFVTLMRWHVELKGGITEYVLTLRRLSWNSSWHYDVDMYIIYEQNNRLLKKLNGRPNIIMLVLTLWCSYV